MTIFSLNTPSSPTTVITTVVTERIYSVYACVPFPVLRDVLKIPLVHIITKLLKGLPKYFNSSRPVEFVVFSVRIIAPCLHSAPNAIKLGLGHAMRNVHKAVLFVAFTATALLGSCAEVHTAYKYVLALVANALTNPHRHAVSMRGLAQHGQKSKGLSSHVYWFTHDSILTDVYNKCKYA